MAWKNSTCTSSFNDKNNEFKIWYGCDDDSEKGAKKKGVFVHTAADTDAVAEVKSAINTKIAAFEGVEE